MKRAVPASRWLAAMALVSLAAVAAALVTQHVFNMLPCPWCVLQRVVFVAIALVCGLGLRWRGRLGRRVVAALAGLLALAGLAAALWQHFVAAANASCNLTFADRVVSALSLDSLLPSVFQPLASCADAAVKLFGLPYEAWSGLLFVLLAWAALKLLRARAA